MQDENFPPPSSLTDKIIGRRYRLGRLLGKGAFGQVFEAEDIKFNPPRIVALKLLNSQFLADPQARAELAREAGTLARFNHPNILRVIDFEVSPEQAYIVTDLAEGGSLMDKIRPATGQPFVRLPLPQVVQYMEQICEALDEAHAVGLVHRDIKPLNILLNKNNRPLLADFGLAAALTSSSTSVLVDTNTSGTPLYMSPEQWAGQAGKPSDIYALGVVTFQLIAGQPPFQGNQAALAYQHINAPVPRLAERAPDLNYPPRLDSVLATALAKDPRQRFRSATEFANQLKLALAETENPVQPSYNPAQEKTQVALPFQPAENSFSPTQPITTPPNFPTPPANLPASATNRPGGGKAWIILGGAALAIILAGLIGWFALSGNKPANNSSSLPGSPTDASGFVVGQGKLQIQVIEAADGTTARGNDVQLAVYKPGDRNQKVASAGYTDKAELNLPPGKYEVVAKYSDNIEVTEPVFEIKAGQILAQTINLGVGRVQIQLQESDTKSARDNDVQMKFYKQGDRNKEIANASYSSKADIALKPGKYEAVIKYANAVTINQPAFEIKEGQTVSQILNLHIGRAQIQIFEALGKTARDNDIQMKIYKPGDYNTVIADASYTNKAEVALSPGTYEIVIIYANQIKMSGTIFEIKEGQITSQTINLQVGRTQIQLFEADNIPARDADVQMKIYKPGDTNNVIADASYANKADIALKPGTYQAVIKYANLIEVTAPTFEIKEGQSLPQTINLHVGRIQLQVTDASGKAADDSLIQLKIYAQGNRNTEVTNASYTNKADLALKPGKYEIVLKYGDKPEIVSPVFEIKEGQTVTQILKV